MRERNAHPRQHRAKRGDRREPVERGRRTTAATVEVGEQREEGCEGEGVDGHTVWQDLGEDARRLTLLRKHKESTRGRV